MIRVTLDLHTKLDPGPCFELVRALVEDEFTVAAGSATKVNAGALSLRTQVLLTANAFKNIASGIQGGHFKPEASLIREHVDDLERAVLRESAGEYRFSEPADEPLADYDLIDKERRMGL
jgi:hypothetical protein